MKKTITILLILFCVGISKAQDKYLEFKEDPDFKLGMEHTKNKEYEKAFEVFKKSAEKGNIASMHEIGLRYFQGFYYTKINYNEALIWFKKSAEHEDITGMYLTGMVNSALKDYIEAINWYKKASDKGDIRSTIKLGDMYSMGLGVSKNNTEALIFYKKAYEKDVNGGIAYNIGEIYYSGGNGVTINYSEAVNWYRKAAEKDYELAMNMLGDIYYNELSEEISEEEAIKWLKKSISKGNEDAAELLNEIVKKNIVEAVEDYNKSSN